MLYFVLLAEGVRLYAHSRSSIEIRGFIVSIYHCIHEQSFSSKTTNKPPAWTVIGDKISKNAY